GNRGEKPIHSGYRRLDPGRHLEARGRLSPGVSIGEIPGSLGDYLLEVVQERIDLAVTHSRHPQQVTDPESTDLAPIPGQTGSERVGEGARCRLPAGFSRETRHTGNQLRDGDPPHQLKGSVGPHSGAIAGRMP